MKQVKSLSARIPVLSCGWWAGVGVVLFGLVANAGRGEGNFPARPDYTVYVRVESIPAGAEVYALDPGANGQPQWLGETPCTLVMQCTFERWLFGVKAAWRSMQVWTAGDVVRAAYDREGN